MFQRHLISWFTFLRKQQTAAGEQSGLVELGAASKLTQGWEFDRKVDTETFDKVYNSKTCPMV